MQRPTAQSRVPNIQFLLPIFRERAAKRVIANDFFCGNPHSVMTVEDPHDISGLLAAWAKGDEEALGLLVSFVYPELRRIARQHLRRCAAGDSLESDALANEAYLKLIRARHPLRKPGALPRPMFASHPTHSRGSCAQP